jgi:hypothetical protein
VVLGSVQMMTVRNLGVMRGLFVISSLVMFGSLTVMLGRLLMVVGCFFMMLMDFGFRHFFLLSFSISKAVTIAGVDDAFATSARE